jgi:hypothetical protein
MGSVLDEALCRPFGGGLNCICSIFSSLQQGWAGGLAWRALVHLVSRDPLGIAEISFGQHCPFVLSQGNVLIDELGFGFGVGAFS